MEILETIETRKTMIVITILICLAAFVAVASHTMDNEQKLIEKAETNWFYHALAKMICSNYKGYYPDEEEVKASKEFVREKSEYDTHPIGSYLKMRNECNNMLKWAGNFHNYRLNFNLGEVGTGLVVMLVFVGVVTLGVVLC